MDRVTIESENEELVIGANGSKYKMILVHVKSQSILIKMRK